MSFEGRLQEVCSRGHYDETSTVYMNEKFKQKRRSKRCRYCGRRYVWRNLLNDTNYPGEGFIPIIVLREGHRVGSSPDDCPDPSSEAGQSRWDVPIKPLLETQKKEVRQGGKKSCGLKALRDFNFCVRLISVGKQNS